MRGMRGLTGRYGASFAAEGDRQGLSYRMKLEIYLVVVAVAALLRTWVRAAR